MNPWRGLGGLPGEVWILFSATLINRAGTMVLPFLILYLTKQQGFSAERAGLTITAYGIGALITAPLSGRLSDWVGPLKIMKASLLLSGAILLVFAFVHGFVAILALTLVWAVINEALRPASMAIIADLVAPEQRRAAFALNRLAINLGMSVGPVVGGFLAMASFTALFLVDGATSILAGLVLIFSPWRVKPQDSRPGSKEGDEPGPLINHVSAFKDRYLLYFVAALVPVEIVFFQHQAAMPLFLVRDLQISESAYGMLFAINTVLIILLEIPLTTRMAGWANRHCMALGSFLCAIGFGALAFATGVLSVSATIVIWTFGEMILFPSSSAYVSEIAPAKKQGEYMGLYVMTFSIAFVLGPWLGTVILERFGASVLWPATFVCGALSALMLGRVYSKPARRGAAETGP